MQTEIRKICSGDSGLTWKFQVNPESCDNPGHYEDYIRFCAISDQLSGRGTTYIMVESDDNASPIRILGFITFKASSFLMDDGEGHELGEGAFEISELAVSSECERRGVGTDLVKYATVLATELNEEKLGIRYVVLCADPAAEDFYSKPALGLHRIGDFYRIPNEHWNTNCIPMVVKLFN